jgi:ATP-dependent DNA helicase RecG
MISDDDLRRLLASPETDIVERTSSLRDRDKLAEAICAFANDLPDRRAPGYLIIGVHDDGRCAGVPIDDELLRSLGGFRSDGTITPFPVLTVERRVLDGCTLAVVEVHPSDNPPVRFNGRTCVRIGPRRGYATPEEERRLTEKRRWGALPFDQQPVVGATIDDLDLLRFREEYLPAAVHPDALAENRRDVRDQLLALRLVHRGGAPTPTGLLVCGKDPRALLPGAYVQFVRYPGGEIGDSVVDHHEIGGMLSDQMRRLDEILALNIARRAAIGGTRQDDRPTYPLIALQELARNAVIHRTYEGTAMPVRLTWFDDRVEITSPGGPYGMVTVETFGQPGPTDYRNPALAEAAKNLGFVQKFGSGIARARAALERNGNPPPEFRAEPTYVHVTVRAAP